MADTESVGRYIFTTQQNISQHIDNIYKDGGLNAEATHKKFLLVRQEGNRQVKRGMDHYNPDMVIALGSVSNRRWQHVSVVGRRNGFMNISKRDLRWMTSGFKQGGNRYFRELLQRIMDIRSSERNFYQQVTYLS